MTDGVLDGLEVWSLDLDDLALVGNKTGATRLRFAVLLKFFESRARFPLDRAEVPVEAVASLAEQVGVEFGSLAGYDWSGRSWKSIGPRSAAGSGSGRGRSSRTLSRWSTGSSLARWRPVYEAGRWRRRRDSGVVSVESSHRRRARCRG